MAEIGNGAATSDAYGQASVQGAPGAATLQDLGVQSPASPGLDTSEPLPIELVFGMVGPTGVDLRKVCDSLRAQLESVGYEAHTIHLSELIMPFIGKANDFASEFDRITTLMKAGTELRETTRQADIVGRLGIACIQTKRNEISGSKLPSRTRKIAYIVRSFKRPEEVDLYRVVYGKAFTLISVYAPKQSRVANLQRVLRPSPEGRCGPEELAARLVAIDNDEQVPFGQQVGATFPLADLFVSSDSKTQLDRQLSRLVRLTFGDPYVSPSRDEQAMFFAQAAAVRSLDLSRQVGAAIVTTDGDILSTGCNEVPRFGGGLYWADDEGVSRDYELGKDSNATIKAELVEDAVHRMKERGWLSHTVARKSDRSLAELSLQGEDPFFRGSRIFDVIEFGRAVHAEMAAITQAARLGVRVDGARLFCTTFPCHICARHIVAVGVREVVFIEPYEKSRASELFGDSIAVEPHPASPVRVNFRAFVGVAPRRYMDYFQLTESRKSEAGATLDANAIAKRPRIKRIVLTYLEAETMFVNATAKPQQGKLSE